MSFDWKYYICNNLDLIKDGIADEKKATEHYNKYGKKENREAWLNENKFILTKKYNKTHSIDENDIRLTKNINKSDSKLENLILIDNINDINEFILIIDFNNQGGGTTFFLNTIVSFYKKFNTFLIIRFMPNFTKFLITINDEYELNSKTYENNVNEFLKKNEKKINKIFINHISFMPLSFINFLFTLDKKVSTISHDYCIFFNKSSTVINYTDRMCNPPFDLKKLDTIFIQNIGTLKNVSHAIPEKSKIIIAPLPDYGERLEKITTNNKKIVIAVIGNINRLKGSDVISELKFLNNVNSELFVIGKIIDDGIPQKTYVNIREFNDILMTKKPNIILSTSLWPETYSYTLTLAMLTDLPILTLRLECPSTVEERLKEYKKYDYFHPNDIPDLVKKIAQYKQNYFYTIKPTIFYNDVWDEYFGKPFINRPYVNKQLINKPNIYAVYFPQFHEITENNNSFYKGFTDITNLKLYNEEKCFNDSPDLKYFEINKIEEYDYNNLNIINKQIKLLNDYNISGFCMYYYWFSINTTTNENMIFKKGIDNFFNDEIKMMNKKVFFSWANEDWTNKSAFGRSDQIIQNNYEEKDFILNCDNLIPYFKHNNYLKINNKPIFYIHHSYIFTKEKLDLFIKILNDKCVNNGFNGVSVRINSMGTNFGNFYKYYDHSPEYKNENTKHTYLIKGAGILEYKKVIDYQKYIEYLTPSNNVQSLFFDFDNTIRFYKPNNSRVTVCINNNEENIKLMISKIKESYYTSRTEEDNILLVNAWNEWGEKMYIEPSEKNGFKYLDLIKNMF